MAGCGGGGADVDAASASVSGAGPLLAAPLDDAAEIAATRAALTSLLEDARLAAQPAADRATALLGGGGRREGGATPPVGGSSGGASLGGGGILPSVPVISPVVVPGAPAIDVSKLLAPALGFDLSRVLPTREIAPPGEGVFRTVCGTSHMSFDDPIVYPGQPGRSHLHTFFGNTKLDANSNSESIRSTGNSTCRGGIANRSAYWVPTMIDTRTGSPIAPYGVGVYYKNGLVDGTRVQPLPAGLRMIAGDAAATGPSSVLAARFKCVGGPRNQNDSYGPTIPNCDVGAEVWQEIFFPACWDGRNLDAPDHKSHMSYYVADRTSSTGLGCPSTHPVTLPAITFNVMYTVTSTDAPLHWRLSSDAYSTSTPGGYSSHGDWFNGWIADVSDTFVKRCVQAKKDCHSHLLGDGRQIF